MNAQRLHQCRARDAVRRARRESVPDLAGQHHPRTKTKTADCPLSKPNRLVLRVDLAEESIDYTVRIDGADWNNGGLRRSAVRRQRVLHNPASPGRGLPMLTNPRA